MQILVEIGFAGSVMKVFSHLTTLMMTEFVFTLCKFMKATCKSYDSDVQMGEKIFDPFEINDIDSNIIDYQGDIDPDKNYFNQLSHHLSKSSNYHTEESFNKFILRNNLDKDNLSMITCKYSKCPGQFNWPAVLYE